MSQASSLCLMNLIRMKIRMVGEEAKPRKDCHRAQASLSITNSWSPPKPMSIKSGMPSNHLILFHPLLILPSIFLRIRVFSNELALRLRWPKYWSFSFSISLSSEYPGLSSLGLIGWISLQSKGLSRVFSNTNSLLQQFKSINSSTLSFLYSSTLTSTHDY